VKTAQVSKNQSLLFVSAQKHHHWTTSDGGRYRLGGGNV
jgi:hypothetical protein